MRVEGQVGPRSSFEVSINGKQIYSKLQQNAFPDYTKIAREVAKASDGVEFKQVTDVQKQCTIQ